MVKINAFTRQGGEAGTMPVILTAVYKVTGMEFQTNKNKPQCNFV